MKANSLGGKVNFELEESENYRAAVKEAEILSNLETEFIILNFLHQEEEKKKRLMSEKM